VPNTATPFDVNIVCKSSMVPSIANQRDAPTPNSLPSMLPMGLRIAKLASPLLYLKIQASGLGISADSKPNLFV